MRATLQPYLQSLIVQDRRELPKMSDGILPFVSKAVEYAETNASFQKDKGTQGDKLASQKLSVV